MFHVHKIMETQLNCSLVIYRPPGPGKRRLITAAWFWSALGGDGLRYGRSGLDVLFVEGVWIEVAEPIFDVVMLRVLGIGENFELGIEARDSAAILGRCRLLAGEVARIGRSWSSRRMVKASL